MIGADAIEFDAFTIIGVVAITLGIIGIGVVDSKENQELKEEKELIWNTLFEGHRNMVV